MPSPKPTRAVVTTRILAVGMSAKSISPISEDKDDISTLVLDVRAYARRSLMMNPTNSAKNAAYLALQILALQDSTLASKLKDFRKKLADDAAASGIDVKF